MKQEHQKCVLRKQAEARDARYHAGGVEASEMNMPPDPTSPLEGSGIPGPDKAIAVKRDFFGRPTQSEVNFSSNPKRPNSNSGNSKEEKKVWVTYHEGFSNAVRKPLTLEELLKEFEKPA